LLPAAKLAKQFFMAVTDVISKRENSVAKEFALPEYKPGA
jgi:hypothetical protein